MTARDDILDKIRRAHGRGSMNTPENIRDRLQSPKANIIPNRGKISGDDKIKQFIDEAERVEATTKSISDINALPDAIATYLKENNLPAALKISTDPLLSGVDWKKAPVLTVSTEPVDGADEVGVSVAFSGVAETGTLVFVSSPENPTRLNFYPITHIAVIRVDDITGAYEDVWQKIRQTNNAHNATGIMPRTVNFITGPSRTADIEQTLLLGAHGPQRLHIILVG